jgi:hypothetical protein
MPFKHKLSVRLAISRTLLAALTVAVLSCGENGAVGPGVDVEIASELANLVISPSSATVVVNDSVDFQAYGITTAGDSVEVAVTWTSTTDNPVQDRGKGLGRLKAKKPGKFGLSAHVDSVHLADTVEVTVVEPKVAEVLINPASVALEIGQQLRLTVTFKDSSGVPLESPLPRLRVMVW